MSRILAFFDTKNNATQALDQIYQLFDNDDDIDVRVYNSQDLSEGQTGAITGVVLPNPSSDPRGAIPVTGMGGGLGLTQDEQRFFTERVGEDSVFTVIRAEKEREQKILQTIQQYNGQIFEGKH
jgi:hypothetical protein